MACMIIRRSSCPLASRPAKSLLSAGSTTWPCLETVHVSPHTSGGCRRSSRPAGMAQPKTSSPTAIFCTEGGCRPSRRPTGMIRPLSFCPDRCETAMRSTWCASVRGRALTSEPRALMARLQLVSPMHPSECMPAGRRWEAAPVTAPYSVSAGCTIRRSGAALGAARAETPAKARDHERNLGRDYALFRRRAGPLS